MYVLCVYDYGVCIYIHMSALCMYMAHLSPDNQQTLHEGNSGAEIKYE